MTIAMRSLRLGLTVLLLGACVPATSHALTKCSARLDKKTGVILVYAKSIVGPLLWGASAGMETNSFANEATCISGTKAKKCELGLPGAPERTVPPAEPALSLRRRFGVLDVRRGLHAGSPRRRAGSAGPARGYRRDRRPGSARTSRRPGSAGTCRH